MIRAATFAMTLAMALAAMAQSPPASSFQWSVDPASVRVSLGSEPVKPEEPARVLSIFVEPPNVINAIGLPPMAGSWTVRDGAIEFRPRYPFEPGLTYRATLQLAGKSPISSTFKVPKAPLERTTVLAEVFPTASVLPQNLLKFYLQFSAPMRGGHIYEHIQLAEEDGSLVELPFLEIDEELWNPEMTRLTLFLDPGRIKREVKPLEEIGPALYPGRKYVLRVDDHWQDARGARLKASFEKEFEVVEPDRDPPDPKKWKIAAAKAGSLEAVEVRFDKPLDHALALRMIGIKNLRGEYVGGSKSLRENESVWQFVPDEPWQAGGYLLHVQSTIEDLAGNNIGKPFEVDLEEGARREAPKTIRLAFEVK